MATHSSVLAWRTLRTEEPGGLPSMGLHRVGHDWSDLAAAAAPSFLTPFPILYAILLEIQVFSSCLLKTRIISCPIWVTDPFNLFWWFIPQFKVISLHTCADLYSAENSKGHCRLPRFSFYTILSCNLLHTLITLDCWLHLYHLGRSPGYTWVSPNFSIA